VPGLAMPPVASDGVPVSITRKHDYGH